LQILPDVRCSRLLKFCDTNGDATGRTLAYMLAGE
jgi:hypothetical protein